MSSTGIQIRREAHQEALVECRDVALVRASEQARGYAHSAYARSLAEFGVPRALPRSKGWILERAISGSPYRDAMGCYPLFACQDWSQLAADLEDMRDGLVSLALVTDPFGNYDRTLLQQCFRDVVTPFKEHFCIDLHVPMEQFVCRHHRRNARKALGLLHVERCPNPAETLDDWAQLYSHLIRRHGITGIAAFSRVTFARQLAVPGLAAFRVLRDDTLVGMALFYVQDQVGYYHLGAYSPLGYDLHASFALFWHAIEYFAAHGLRWLALGAGAGLRASATDGLSRFKKGWSTGTRTTYFCGRIFDRRRYAELVAARGATELEYFPAYRVGEWH